MVLKVLEDNSIHLTRGDTAYLSVPIVNDLTGDDYELAATDKLTLSIKRTLRDAEPCVQKELVGSNVFHICPEDTCDCEFASYKYDVQLTTAAGDVYTVIEPSTFKICPEVTV